jgi:hypothetical protein
MSFIPAGFGGGGDAGAASTLDHQHTAAAGDGSVLTGYGIVEQLDSHVCTGAETEIDLVTSKDWIDYSKFFAVFDGELDAASSSVGVQVNSLTGAIYGGIGVFYINTPTANLFQTSGATNFNLCDTTTRLTTSRGFSAIVECMSSETNGTNPMECKGWLSQQRDIYWGFSGFGTGTTSVANFTGVTLLPLGGASNFETDSKGTLYGVKRS